MKRTLVLMPLVVVLLGACSTYNTRMSSQSLRTKDNQNLGTVFVWDNDVSAAIAYPSPVLRHKDGSLETGRASICMQRAMTAGATAMKGDLSVSDSILKVASMPGAEGNDLGKAALNLSKSVLALSVSTERTSFIDTALFYLCQMAANGSLREGELSTAVTELFEAAGSLAASSAEPKSQAAPSMSSEGGKPADPKADPISK